MSETTITVPAAEANRRFSALLRAARNGTRVTITSHGEPVAQLVPVEGWNISEEAQRKREVALEELRAQWALQEPVVVGPWTREELYERSSPPKA
jgi:prevent-host-death family protein